LYENFIEIYKLFFENVRIKISKNTNFFYFFKLEIENAEDCSSKIDKLLTLEKRLKHKLVQQRQLAFDELNILLS